MSGTVNLSLIAHSVSERQPERKPRYQMAHGSSKPGAFRAQQEFKCTLLDREMETTTLHLSLLVAYNGRDVKMARTNEHLVLQ